MVTEFSLEAAEIISRKATTQRIMLCVPDVTGAYNSSDTRDRDLLKFMNRQLSATILCQ